MHTFPVYVTNRNDAPTMERYYRSVDENSGTGATVGAKCPGDDVDVGDAKGVSRQHAIIQYVEASGHFELECVAPKNKQTILLNGVARSRRDGRHYLGDGVQRLSVGHAKVWCAPTHVRT